MEKVAEILGVKLGEKFKIDGCIYRLNEDGLVDNLDGAWARGLMGLLAGNYTIEKLPWKPRKGDGYWWVDFDSSAIEDHWDGCSSDLARYYVGNCFETGEEATAHAPEITEKLRKKYEEE